MSQKQYESIFKKYSNQIINAVKSKEERSIQLPESSFTSVGDRKLVKTQTSTKSNYAFSIVIENGEVKNNIGGSAVARNLRDVLLSSVPFRAATRGIKVKIRLDNKFVLHVEYPEVGI